MIHKASRRAIPAGDADCSPQATGDFGQGKRTKPGQLAGLRLRLGAARQTVIAGWFEGSMMSPRCVMTLSINPYALASSADM